MTVRGILSEIDTGGKKRRTTTELFGVKCSVFMRETAWKQFV